jgi:hypothetical protein
VIAQNFALFTEVFKYTLAHIVTHLMLQLDTHMPMFTYKFLFTFIRALQISTFSRIVLCSHYLLHVFRCYGQSWKGEAKGPRG